MTVSSTHHMDLEFESDLNMKGIKNPCPVNPHHKHLSSFYFLSPTSSLAGLNEILRELIAWQRKLLIKGARKKNGMD